MTLIYVLFAAAFILGIFAALLGIVGYWPFATGCVVIIASAAYLAYLQAGPGWILPMLAFGLGGAFIGSMARLVQASTHSRS